MDFTVLFSGVSWYPIVGAAAVLMVLLSGWILFLNKFNPTYGTMDEPDAVAIAKGNCGDSMKISLKFRRGKVVDASYWTDGCKFSSECGAAATRLALGKTPEEIADIDYIAVKEAVGGIPEEDLHCATLAAGTLQESVRIYCLDLHKSQSQTVSAKM
jgi:nitrogen fixation protein NifU and related proteins